jgi:N-glycosylase/DNA lyase
MQKFLKNKSEENMKNQEYKIENIKSFELADIFDCGQCFRWNRQQDGSYTGVFKGNVMNVQKEGNTVTFKGICNSEIKEIVEDYFDLNRNYEDIKEQLSKVDENVKKSTEYGKGIRILNQDLWEMIISYIISANNNIPRIKGIIERLSKNYGKEIEWNGEKYYTFPSVEELKNVTVEEYRKLGAGFRDIRLYETVQMILDKKVDLEKMQKNPNTFEIREELLTLSGVGPKVADCILLFSSLKRFEVFPIDVWVRRVMNELYIKNEDETKVNKKEIEKLAHEKFGNLAGIAQQYLFYWKREA